MAYLNIFAFIPVVIVIKMNFDDMQPWRNEIHSLYNYYFLLLL